MKRRSFLILGAIFVAITAGIVAQWLTRARLVHELDSVRQPLHHTAASRRTQIDQTFIPESADKRLLEQTSSETPQPIEQAARQPGTVGRPVEANLSAIGLMRPENWKNAGRQTPSAAFETLEWALDRGETDTLAASLTFEPEVRFKLDELFSNLSAEVRSKYNTPENIIALLVSGSSKGPQAFQVIGEAFSGPDIAIVRVRVQEPDDHVEENNMPFCREADGWKAVIPEQKALEKMHEFFPEATWKTIESKKR